MSRGIKRHLGIAGVVATSIALLGVSAAAADAPTERTEQYTFTEPNPCTGVWETVIHTVTISEQEGGADVRRDFHELSTSSGYTGSGRVIAVRSNGGWTIHFNHLLSDESGSRYRDSGRLVVSHSGAHKESERTCIR